MNRTIRLLRHTARLLLVLTPLTLLTGFLAAKWFVAEGWVAPATVRAWHVQWLPLAFVPVVFVHSLCGILFLLQRSKRFDRPAVRAGAAVLWTAVLGLFVWLYLARPPAPPRVAEPDPQAEHDASIVAEQSAPDAADEPRTAPSPAGVDATTAPDPHTAAPTTPAPVLDAAPAETGADTAADPDAAVPPDGPRTEPEAAATLRDAGAARDAAADEARRAESLLQARCASCHGLDKVRSARHDAAGWTASIDRMIGYGAVVSAREKALLVRYLAGR